MQVLSFEYQLSVIAIDACSHHGRITDARAERIKKYYAAKMRKSRYGIDLSRVQEAVAVAFLIFAFGRDSKVLQNLPSSRLLAAQFFMPHADHLTFF